MLITSKTMAESTSVMEELLTALKLPKLQPMPAYISEADAVTVDGFLQSNFAKDFVLDTSNIHWGVFNLKTCI